MSIEQWIPLVVLGCFLGVGWLLEHRMRVRAERWARQLADRLTVGELRRGIRLLDETTFDPSTDKGVCVIRFKADGIHGPWDDDWADDGCGEFNR